MAEPSGYIFLNKFQEEFNNAYVCLYTVHVCFQFIHSIHIHCQGFLDLLFPKSVGIWQGVGKRHNQDS